MMLVVLLFIPLHRLSAATNFTVPKVQIVIGLLACWSPAVLATKISARQFQRRALGPVPQSSAMLARSSRSRLCRVQWRS
jgi:hypothetical protein